MRPSRPSRRRLAGVDGVLGTFDPTCCSTIRTGAAHGLRSAAATRRWPKSSSVARQRSGSSRSRSRTEGADGGRSTDHVIRRVYDSRDKRTGDFGVGWHLDLQTLRLRGNRVLGTGWERASQERSSAWHRPTHKVSLTLRGRQGRGVRLVCSPASRATRSVSISRRVGLHAAPGDRRHTSESTAMTAAFVERESAGDRGDSSSTTHVRHATTPDFEYI